MQPGTGSPWCRAVLVCGHVVTPIVERGPARLRPTATAAAPEARNGCFVNTSSHNLRGHTLPISVDRQQLRPSTSLLGARREIGRASCRERGAIAGEEEAWQEEGEL